MIIFVFIHFFFGILQLANKRQESVFNYIWVYKQNKLQNDKIMPLFYMYAAVYTFGISIRCGQRNGSNNEKCCTFSNLFTQPKIDNDQCIVVDDLLFIRVLILFHEYFTALLSLSLSLSVRLFFYFSSLWLELYCHRIFFLQMSSKITENDNKMMCR